MNLTTQGLQRFVEAQDRVYESVCDELAMGEKTSHWMWFVFPQLKALGRSPMAKHYGIESREEALAYWNHPILGKRLLECTRLLLAQRNENAHEIFGSPDDAKFKSCLTLSRRLRPRSQRSRTPWSASMVESGMRARSSCCSAVGL